MNTSLEELVRNAPEAIRGELHLRSYDRGSFIFTAEPPTQSLYFIQSGVVEVIKESYSGAEILVNNFSEGSILGEIELFCPELVPYKVRCKTDCRLIYIRREIVFRWMQLDFEFTRFICRTLALRLYNTSNSMSRIAMLPLKQRVLGCIYDQHRAGTLSSFTKEMLVDQTRAPLRSINRILKECRNGGIVAYGQKTFHVLDEKALSEYARQYEI